MDQDTIRQVLEVAEYKPLTIDWEPILWLFGIFSAIIGSLITLSWFLGKAYLETIITSTNKQIASVNNQIVSVIETNNKHEKWILQQQKDMSDWSRKTDTSIELIKQEQKQGQERLRIFQENFDFGKNKKK